MLTRSGLRTSVLEGHRRDRPQANHRFLGPNSSGKTSLFQALLLMKQTDESPDRGIVFNFGDETTPVNLGDFESIIHGHDTERTLKFSLGWKLRGKSGYLINYIQSVVTYGDDLGFEIELRQESIGVREIDGVGGDGLSNCRAAVWNAAFTRSDGLRSIRPWVQHRSFSRYRGAKIFIFHRPIKFHHFPYGWYGQGRDLLLDLQHGLTLLLRGLHYLGPLRSHPNRTYSRSGARPIDMGPSGESAVDALLSSKELDTRITVLEHPQDAVHPYHSPFENTSLGGLGA